MTVNAVLTQKTKPQNQSVSRKNLRSLWRPLDTDFDRAVVDICNKLLPEGYVVCDDAPDTFEALIASSKTSGPLKIWSGASEYTIYGSKEVNYAFRAWHDHCHVLGRFPFTLAGEAAACEMQLQHIVKFYGDTVETMQWRVYLLAEILGQAMFAYAQMSFPMNQRRFVGRFSSLLLEKEAQVPQQEKVEKERQ